jgi:nitroreductase
MTTLSTIKARASYRGKYKDAPVPREDLIKIMEAGLAAPSGCNTQTTSLIAVDDAELLAKLRGILQSELAEAPAMICVLTQAIPAWKDTCFNVQDYSAAIQNMLLAIVELGYQSCWVEGQVTDLDNLLGRQMAALLGVPDGIDLICYLPVGIAEQPLSYAGKKPFEERAWFNGYRNG